MESTVRIGLLHSLSGTMAISETSLRDVELMAIAEINEAGGVRGRQIEPVIEDGASNWSRFADKAQKLSELDQVTAIFGCWTSASRKAVLPVVERLNALLWYPVQYEGLEASRNIFYMGATPNQQVEPAVRWLLANNRKRFYLLGSDYVFPHIANKIINAMLHHEGGELVREEYTPLGETSYAQIVDRIARLKPDVVFNTLNGDSNAAFYQQFTAAGISAHDIPIMAVSIAEDELRVIGGENAAGHYAAWNYFQSIDSPTNRAFLSRFKARYGQHRVTSDPIEAAYIQVYLWKQAVEAAQSFDIDRVRTAAYQQTFEAPEGLVRIENNHHLWKYFRIGEIQPDGQFKIVHTTPDAIKPQPWLGVDDLQGSAAIDMLYEASQAVDYSIQLEQKSRALEVSNQTLGRRADQLNIITLIGQHVSSLLNLDTLLHVVVEEIQRAFQYYAVALYLLSADQTVLHSRATAGDHASDNVQHSIDQQSLIGTAAFSRQLIYIPDLAKDERYSAAGSKSAARSEVSVPLIVGTNQRLLGVLDIQSSDPESFSPDDLDVIRIIADQISVAIRNAELYEESEQARKLADEANRLKSEFLSTMSHELRTPLNVIIGYSHSILNRPAMYDNVPLPPVYEEGMQSIMTSGRHLLGLITDILDLSKIEAGKIDLNIEAADPLPILQGVRSTALGLVKKGVQIRVDYADSLPLIMGDEVRVRQILLNLISNAARFTEQGFIALDAVVLDDTLRFSVVDTGVGIPVEAQAHLFNRFQQATRDILKKYGGTGLGLSICRQLTLLHGGQIWFKSTVGEGTTFYFTIPLSPDQIAILPAPTMADDPTDSYSRVNIFDAPDEEAPQFIHQVLLVDTHSETRNDLQAMLTNSGYDVLIADTAARAVSLASTMLPEAIVIHRHPDDGGAIAELLQAVESDEMLAQIGLVVYEPEEAFSALNAIRWQPLIEQINALFVSQP